jgi:hypothetical protein
MIAFELTAATRPVRRSGDEHAEFAFALSDTRSPMAALLGTTLSDSPGIAPDDDRLRAAIHSRAPAIRGASSRASLARSFASSALVRSSDESAEFSSDAPASKLNELADGVRLATAVAPTFVAWNDSDVLDDPLNVLLNGTSAKSPPDVPPATQSEVPLTPVTTWPSVSVVPEVVQSVLAICVAVAEARAESPCTVAVISTLPTVAPSVTCVDTVPLASLTAVVGASVAVPLVTANDTVTPETGASDAVVTSKTIGEVRVVPTEPDCPLPLTAAIAAGVVDGLVESLLQAASVIAPIATSAFHRTLPRVPIREIITVSAFSGGRLCFASACRTRDRGDTLSVLRGTSRDVRHHDLYARSVFGIHHLYARVRLSELRSCGIAETFTS